MIEARALVSINFLNLSENYDFMSRWLGVYDKYAKLLKGSSDAVVKDGSDEPFNSFAYLSYTPNQRDIKS